MGSRDLIGQSAAMRRVMDLANRAASSHISILVEGESGVGKEMVARAIQGSSERAGKSFVAVNCGAIPENLVESILFGHERGAFTGANARHVGKFQEADGGTLFLDEIGELKPDIQVKLLRALQEGEVDLVGGNKPIEVDVRLISATNRNLAELVAEGSFREDLYYRLNVFPILVPPLRERRDDIGPLVEHFISLFSNSERKDVRSVDEATMMMLRNYDWQGNVRQLENMVYRAVVLADGNQLTIEDFPQLAQTMGLGSAVEERPGPAASNEDAAPLAVVPTGSDLVSARDGSGQFRSLDAIEAEVIRRALDHYGGQMSEVARRLGIGRSTLYRKVREHGIEIEARTATSAAGR
jgi:DNA-binding NtrC family response regulator